MSKPWQQEVTCLPLAPGVRAQLLGHGFRTVADLQTSSVQELVTLAGISFEDAQEVMQTAESIDGVTFLPGAVLASELVQAERQAQRIMTRCADLDRLLEGGVCCGYVTEFCGVPGVGKTQLGMQLAVNAQLPKVFQGAAGAAVYIDTEGSFIADRVADIALASSRDVNNTAQALSTRQPADAEMLELQMKQFSFDAIMSNIHVLRAQDAAQQLACIHLLPGFLSNHPEVKLVVVDSITFHFRQDMKDFSARSRTLTGMAQALMMIAEQHQVAVVLMNQVTTKVMGDAAAQLVPALGESWGHAASTRVLLHWQGSERWAYLHKSPYLAPGSAQYLVTADGIKGLQRPSKRSAAAMNAS